MVKVALFGVGNVGTEVIKFLHRLQAEIVAVFTRTSNLGKDVGEVVGIGPIGVKIQAAAGAKEALASIKPDICLFQTEAGLSANEASFLMCAELGINVLTLSEEAFYPNWQTSAVAKKLDKAFKENNCTFTGSGFQDFQCNHALTAIAAVQEVKKISMKALADVNQYCRNSDKEKAKGFLAAMGLGSDLEESKAIMQDSIYQSADDAPEGIIGNIIRWICAALGWDIKNFKVEPFSLITSTNDVYLKVVDETWQAGRVIGLNERATAETSHGVKFDAQFGFKASEEGVDDEFLCWDLESVPNMSLRLAQNDTLLITVGPFVNRILDVIAAPPGYVTTDKLPPLRSVRSLK